MKFDFFIFSEKGVCTKQNAKVDYPPLHTTKTRQKQIKSGVLDDRDEHRTKQKTGTTKEQRNTETNGNGRRCFFVAAKNENQKRQQIKT